MDKVALARELFLLAKQVAAVPNERLLLRLEKVLLTLDSAEDDLSILEEDIPYLDKNDMSPEVRQNRRDAVRAITDSREQIIAIMSRLEDVKGSYFKKD